MNRREFTKVSGMGLIGLHTLPAMATGLLPGETHTGNRKIPLGVCDYALRGLKVKAKETIEYAIEHQLDSVLFNSFKSFRSLDDGHLSEINQLAGDNDVTVYIGAFCISETSSEYRGGYADAEDRLKEGIRIAKAVGSPIVATRIGMLAERYGKGGIELHIREVIRVMKAMRGPVLDAGVKFAMENHQELRSEELLRIIQEVGPDACGVLFDPANTICVMDEPDRAMSLLGKHILANSSRDFMVYETEEGATMQCTSIGKGQMDYKSYTDFLAENCPGVPIHVETIGRNKKVIPFLKPEFWEGFRDVPATGIIDFLKAVREGQPVEIPDCPEGMDKQAFEIEQQKKMLKESLDFLRTECGAGLK